MNDHISQPHLSAYLSGVVLGAAALLLIAAPHVKIDTPSFAAPGPSCAARVSQDQAVQLEAAVVDAQGRRDALVRGPSVYAAAKLGVAPDQVDPAALRAADRAVQGVRARFIWACA